MYICIADAAVGQRARCIADIPGLHCLACGRLAGLPSPL